MTKKLKLSFLFAITLIFILTFTLAACGNGQQADEPDEIIDNTEDILDEISDEDLDENVEESFEVIPDIVKGLVIDFLFEEMHWIDIMYFAADQPNSPQDGDCRIDNITYIGKANLPENEGLAFRVDTSFFQDGWDEYRSPYVILERDGKDKGWNKVLGSPYETETYPDTNKSGEAVVLEFYYNLWDIEVSIKFDGIPDYIGPGSNYIPIDETYDFEILHDYYFTDEEEDYWFSQNYDNLESLWYHQEYSNENRLYQINTTRTDAETFRGVRIGMDLDQVLEAFADLLDRDNVYHDEDFFWYSSETVFGPSLSIIFEDNKVVEIVLDTMIAN